MKILTLILGSVALLLLVIYLLYRILDGIYDRRVAAYQNKLLKNEVDEVHNLYLTMRGWCHDYHNHMQSVKAYLAMDSLEEARAYLDALEQDLDDINLLFNTGNMRESRLREPVHPPLYRNLSKTALSVRQQRDQRDSSEI